MFRRPERPLVGDRAIGEIAAGLEDGEARLGRRPVHHHIARIHQTVERPPPRHPLVVWRPEEAPKPTRTDTAKARRAAADRDVITRRDGDHDVTPISARSAIHWAVRV